MLILVFLFAVPILQISGDTEIFCPNHAPKCGEKVEVICNANKTNSIDICFENYGCHIYERTSYPLASLGPVKLKLTQAKPDRSNYLLSTFQIEAVFTYEQEVTVTCTGGLTFSSLTLMYTERTCNTSKTTTKVNTSQPDIEVSWKRPTCRGWNHIQSYNVSHCHDNGCMQHQFSNDTTSAVLVLYNSTIQTVEIIAVNNCLESAIILENVIETTEVPSVSSTTHEIPNPQEAEQGIDEERLLMILVVVILLVIIITGIVACLLAGFCALYFQRDWGEYKPLEKEKADYV